ncbi:MAG: hypothetical protein QOI42_21 [Frankiaceae bacterium]|nr:hypothetical protein [Frankiaceae bacterium]
MEMRVLLTTAQTGGERSVSPRWLVLYGFVFVILAIMGVSWSIAGRPCSRKLARIGNGVSAAAIGVAGIAMIVIGLAQML